MKRRSALHGRTGSAHTRITSAIWWILVTFPRNSICFSLFCEKVLPALGRKHYFIECGRANLWKRALQGPHQSGKELVCGCSWTVLFWVSLQTVGISRFLALLKAVSRLARSAPIRIWWLFRETQFIFHVVVKMCFPPKVGNIIW